MRDEWHERVDRIGDRVAGRVSSRRNKSLISRVIERQLYFSHNCIFEKKGRIHRGSVCFKSLFCNGHTKLSNEIMYKNCVLFKKKKKKEKFVEYPFSVSLESILPLILLFYYERNN